MTTLIVENDTDFTGQTLNDIDEIAFATVPGEFNPIATFASNQFGPGLISNTVRITGDDVDNNVRVNLSAPGAFSAAGWIFSNWQPAADDDDIFLTGTDGNDNITGSSQADSILGRGGIDTLSGGAGDDTFNYAVGDLAAGDTINGGAGNDAVAVVQGQNIDFSNATISSIEKLDLSNGDGATFKAAQIGAGAIVEVEGDSDGVAQNIVVNGASVDLSALTFISYAAANQILTINGTSATANTLTGSSQRDIITGTGSSADVMTGGGGVDILNGGSGDDTFRYDAASELVAGEAVKGGTGVDELILAGIGGAFNFAAITVTSIQALDFAAVVGTTTATFNSSQATAFTAVDGSIRPDVLVVNASGGAFDLSDIRFSAWTDGVDKVTLNGSNADESIFGSAVDDRIDGKGGADSMTGGAGDDLYFVDDAADTIFEVLGFGNNGTDRALASVSYVLTANARVETLTTTDNAGTDAINLTGNGFANSILGNAGANTLDGLGGVDGLNGGLGNDILIGGTGADALKGDAGLDSASYASAGIGVTASLADPSINTGDAAGDSYNSIENLIGSSFNDALSGDSGANVVRGGSGTDSINGLAGNDRLFGDAGNDSLFGGAGADELAGSVGTDSANYSGAAAGVTASLANAAINTGDAAGDTYSSIENLGGTVFDDALNGSSGVNAINGGSGNDSIKGYAGNDTLTGGAGNDNFVFNSALDAATNVDVITDFNVAADTILLDDLIFTEAGAPGVLAANAFRIAAVAASAADRILYDFATGALNYDEDGTGVAAAIQFATLSTGLALTNADFTVI